MSHWQIKYRIVVTRQNGKPWNRFGIRCSICHFCFYYLEIYRIYLNRLSRIVMVLRKENIVSISKCIFNFSVNCVLCSEQLKIKPKHRIIHNSNEIIFQFKMSFQRAILYGLSLNSVKFGSQKTNGCIQRRNFIRKIWFSFLLLFHISKNWLRKNTVVEINPIFICYQINRVHTEAKKKIINWFSLKNRTQKKHTKTKSLIFRLVWEYIFMVCQM